MMMFTDEQISKLVAAIPGSVDAHRRRLLPRILKEWSQIDLKVHLTRRTPKQIRAECQRIKKVSKQALELKKTLSDLESFGRFAIASELLKTDAAAGFDPLNFEKIRRAERRLSEGAEWLEQLVGVAIKASKAFAPRPVHHKTLVRYLILQDLAAIYEWATGQRAKRLVSPEDGTNCGPFWDFTHATWLMLFNSAAGLDYSLKFWAAARERHEEVSPLIWNIDSRHPEWRIRGTGHHGVHH